MSRFPELDRYQEVNLNIGYRWQGGQGTTDDPTLQPKWEVQETFGLMAAPSGVFNHREHNPTQPYTPAEIAAEAIAAAKAGASGIHFHARDPINGNPSGKIEIWRETISLFREACGNSVVVSGSTVRGEDIYEKMAPVLEGLFESVPINVDPRYSPEFLKAQAEILQDHNCQTELAVFDTTGIDIARKHLIESGVLRNPFSWLLVPALPRGGSFTMPNPMAMVEGLIFLVHRIREIDSNAVIGVAASGRPGHYLVTVGLAMGLNVRVGMEDTIWLYPHKEDRLPENRIAVENAIKVGQTLGRRPMTANEFRTTLGVPAR